MNEEAIKKWILAFKRANRAEKAKLIAGLMTAALAFLYNLPGIGDWLKSYALVNKWLSVSFGIVALVCFVYAAWKIWVAPVAANSQPPLRRPALKGGSKFTADDGNLFYGLGRRRQLAQLLAWIQDAHVSLIAVQGESGAGKSSLLDGGLRFLLSERGRELRGDQLQEPTGCLFCEMRSRDPVHVLITTVSRALSASPLKSPPRLPERLEEVVDCLRQTSMRWVIVLDQFEQISLNQPEHRPLFDFLAAASHCGNPWLTCVVAFRSEYASFWNRFTAKLDPETGAPVFRLLPLELFQREGPDEERAKDVLATIGKEAEMELADVADPLISLLADRNGSVSPFDLSLSLKCLAEMGDPVPKPQSLPVGGFPALIAAYLRKRLEVRFPAQREAVFATIHLKLTRNTREGRQRVAEGMPLADLARDCAVAEPDLKAALDHLADRETGLLEILDDGSGDRRYRLLHERFIPALEQVAGSALAGVQQARRTFIDCWGAYNPQIPKERLLRGSDLALVTRHWQQMPDLHEHKAKRDYYFASLGYRAQRRLAVGGIVAALTLAVLYAVWLYNREQQVYLAKRELTSLVSQYGDVKNDISEEVTSALERLAACNQHARLIVLKQVLEDVNLGTKIYPWSALMARAVVGLDPRGTATREAVALVRPALGGKGSVQFPMEILRNLNVASNDYPPLATAIVGRMTNTAARLTEPEIAELGAVLAPLTQHLPAHRQTAATLIINRMTNRTEPPTDSKIARLGQALAPLAMNSPDHQHIAAEAIVSWMTDPSRDLSYTQRNTLWLGEVLASLATNLPPVKRFPMAAAIVMRITNTTHSLTDNEIFKLGRALAPLATSLPKDQRQKLAAAIVSAMTEGKEHLLGDDRIAALGMALSPLATDLQSEGKTAAEILLNVIAKTVAADPAARRSNWSGFPKQGIALASLTTNLPDYRRTAAEYIVGKMTNSASQSNRVEIVSLAEALAPLTLHLKVDRAPAAASLIINQMKCTSNSHLVSDFLSLSRALGSLTTELPQEVRTVLAADIIALMAKLAAPLVDSSIESLGQAVDSMTHDLPDHRRNFANIIVNLATKNPSTISCQTNAADLMSLMLAPFAKDLREADQVAVIRLTEQELQLGRNVGAINKLVVFWIALEQVVHQKDSLARRIERIAYWLDQPQLTPMQENNDWAYEMQENNNWAYDTDLRVLWEDDAQTNLLRHLENLTGKQFGNDLPAFVAWATDPAGGGRLGIRLPQRPNWRFIKPKPMIYPAARPVDSRP